MPSVMTVSVLKREYHRWPQERRQTSLVNMNTAHCSLPPFFVRRDSRRTPFISSCERGAHAAPAPVQGESTATICNDEHRSSVNTDGELDSLVGSFWPAHRRRFSAEEARVIVLHACTSRQEDCNHSTAKKCQSISTVTMHRKSQSTSALSVILSGHGQPLRSTQAPSISEQSVASSSRLSNAPKPPSSPTSTKTRISHSRTRSDLTSPKSSGIDNRNRDSGFLRPTSTIHDGYCTSPLQKHRRREALSSTEEEEASGPSDLEYQNVARRSGMRRAEKVTTTPERVSDTTYRKPYTSSRLGATVETPRRKEVLSNRSEASFRNMTLESCPAIVSSHCPVSLF